MQMQRWGEGEGEDQKLTLTMLLLLLLIRNEHRQNRGQHNWKCEKVKWRSTLALHTTRALLFLLPIWLPRCVRSLNKAQRENWWWSWRRRRRFMIIKRIGRTVAPGTQISVASVFKGVLCSKKEATDLLFLLRISVVDGREWLIFVSGFLFRISSNRLRSQIQKWLPE